MSVNIIVAVGNYISGKGYPIGKEGHLPWKNSEDLRWFKEKTMNCPVIMGRKTFESIGSKPLPGRTNFVLSRKENTLEDTVNRAKELGKDVWIIGGASVYQEALEKDLVDRVFVDFLAENVEEADSFFLPLDNYGHWGQEGTTEMIQRGRAYAATFVKLRGESNNVDEQYLSIAREILEKGEKKDTRSGMTRSLFGKQMRFDLKRGLPILTTKRVFTRGCIVELLWFLRGDTNIKYLVDNGVHIWDDDAYRHFLQSIQPKFLIQENIPKEEFLKEVQNGSKHAIFGGKNGRGFEYTYGDLGPVYGKQWTDWNGHNQVEDVISRLKSNPDDRRLLISAWNVGDIPSMALPPCHYSCQFYTRKMSVDERVEWAKYRFGTVPENSVEEYLDSVDVPTRKLSCMWNQRSCDWAAGVPFNMLSYALLTHYIASKCNMDVDELIFNGGDCHIYENHVKGIEEQLSRNSHMYALPTLEPVDSSTGLNLDTFKIINYQHYPTIKFELNVG